MTEAPKGSSVDDQILRELKKMNKLLTLTNGEKLEKEIGKFASTNERRMIWALVNGVTQTPEIAQKIGKTKRAVDIFLQSLEDAGLLERAFGKPPRRLVDYVPASWVELVSSKQSAAPEQMSTPSSPSDQVHPSTGAEQNG